MAASSASIGFIGSGFIANAICDGLVGSGVLTGDRLHASDYFHTAAAKLCDKFEGATAHSENADVVKNSDIVVVAVKPQVVTANGGQFLTQLKDALVAKHGADGSLKNARNDSSEDGAVNAAKSGERLTVIVSVCAGLELSAFEGALPDWTPVVRVMPNTPAAVGASASAYALGSAANEADGSVVGVFFGAIGKCFMVKESLMDAVTGVSGSGPAYVFLFIEAMADGGVKAGLPRDVALQLAAQTVMGAAKMVLETGKHPGQLKDQVTSPAGTTIAGVAALESHGLRNSVIEAVTAASDRSKELGGKK